MKIIDVNVTDKNRSTKTQTTTASIYYAIWKLNLKLIEPNLQLIASMSHNHVYWPIKILTPLYLFASFRNVCHQKTTKLFQEFIKNPTRVTTYWTKLYYWIIFMTIATYDINLMFQTLVSQDSSKFMPLFGSSMKWIHVSVGWINYARHEKVRSKTLVFRSNCTQFIFNHLF